MFEYQGGSSQPSVMKEQMTEEGCGLGKLGRMYNMKELTKRQDLIRVILLLASSGYLCHQIYIKTNTLMKWEMGYTEVAVDSNIMKFPSITFCPGDQDERKWFGNVADNITADYKKLPQRDEILRSIQQHFSINQ